MKKILVIVLVLVGVSLLAGTTRGGGFVVGYFQGSLEIVNETLGTNLDDPLFAFGGGSFSTWKSKVLIFDVISGGEGYGIYSASDSAQFSGGLGYGYLGLLLKVGNLGFEGTAGLGGAGFSVLKNVASGDTLSATDVAEHGNVMYVELSGVPAVFGADVTFDVTDNIQVFVGIRYNVWLWENVWVSPFGEEIDGFNFDPLVPQVYVAGLRFGRF